MICNYCESDNTIYHDTFLDTDTYYCNDCNKYFDVNQQQEDRKEIIMDEFKFIMGDLSDFVFTVKKLCVPDPIYIVMWNTKGELQCVDYPIEEALQYIEEGDWKIIK